MLVIKRKVSESILIGDDIEIIISEISQDKVKIAINAPKEIKVIRKELKETCDFNITAASENIDKNSVKNLKSQIKNANKK